MHVLKLVQSKCKTFKPINYMNPIFLVGFFVIFALIYSIRFPLEQRAHIGFFVKRYDIAKYTQRVRSGSHIKEVNSLFFYFNQLQIVTV
jgi:hypothetical protein